MGGLRREKVWIGGKELAAEVCESEDPLSGGSCAFCESGCLWRHRGNIDPMELSRRGFTFPGAFIEKGGLMMDWLLQIE
jgi:hypothetical protein